MKDMLPAEKDLVLLGIISCSVNQAETTLSKTQKVTERKKSRMRGFFYEHRRICLHAFLYLFDMSQNHLHAIRKHFKQNGLVPRKKKSGKLDAQSILYPFQKTLTSSRHGFCTN